ncbi:MAG: hypothetical protein Q8O74_05285, partial [bacterium]|nr:hypothetical protein [bacterium]
MKKSVSLLFAVMALASAALAAPDTVKIFLWDNDAGESAQESPASVMDRNTNSFYVWADARDNNWNIYGRIWGRTPAAFTDAFLVNQFRIDGSDQKAPDVAGTTGDFYFVVWQDSLLKSGAPWQVYVRKFDKSGKPLTDQILVQEKPDIGNAKFPKIAVNPLTQNFVVVWQDNRNGWYDIYARLFDLNCKPLSPDIQINDDATKNPHLYPVLSYSINGIAIAWQDYRFGASPSIFYRYYDVTLKPLNISTIVNDDKAYLEVNHFTPAIAAQDTGFFTIVWQDNRNHVYGDIYAQRYDPNGKPIDQTNIKVNLSITPVVCRTPSVAMGADRISFSTSWADSSSSTNLYQIRTRYFDKTGRFNSILTVNNNEANGQRTPAICRLGDWLSVAWLDSSRAQGLGDIFGQYFVLDKSDSLNTVSVNYNISADRANGRKIWYHPVKNYDDPA